MLTLAQLTAGHTSAVACHWKRLSVIGLPDQADHVRLAGLHALGAKADQSLQTRQNECHSGKALRLDAGAHLKQQAIAMRLEKKGSCKFPNRVLQQHE